MEGTIGEIRLFAGNFAPRDWAFCQGQTIAISSNSALFSILGTTYGGNGTTTFALPNASGRVVVGAGQGPGLSNYALGAIVGQPTVTLSVANMPAHTHTMIVAQPISGTVTLNASSDPGDTSDPTNGLLSTDGNTSLYASPSSAPTAMAPFAISMNLQATSAHPIISSVTSAGGNQPHSNVQPFLGMNYIICLYGIYPARD